MITQFSELAPQEDDPKAYLPSPARIARMCAAIRRGWSDREIQKRSGTKRPERWTAPMVSVRLEAPAYPLD